MNKMSMMNSVKRNIDNELQVKSELEKIRSDIMNKYNALKSANTYITNTSAAVLEPVTKPLSEIREALHKPKRIKKDVDTITDFPDVKQKLFFSTPLKPLKALGEEEEELENDPFNLSETGLFRLSGDDPIPKDRIYGIKYNPFADEYMLGTSPFSWNEDRKEIYVGKGDNRVKFPYTKGLMHLLLNTNVDKNEYTDDDLVIYKKLLVFTGAHLRADGRLKGLNNSKYKDIIRPLFRGGEHSGKGYYEKILSVKEPKKKRNRIYSNISSGISLKKPRFEYWNDPNELVERLQLLHASKQSGNTGVDNEILAIEEELAEDGYIQLPY